MKKRIIYTDLNEISVPELSYAEQQWVVALAEVLARCPERLELLATGDASLCVIDRAGAALSDLYDGAAVRDGIVLADVSGPKVHGVSC